MSYRWMWVDNRILQRITYVFMYVPMCLPTSTRPVQLVV